MKRLIACFRDSKKFQRKKRKTNSEAADSTPADSLSPPPTKKQDSDGDEDEEEVKITPKSLYKLFGAATGSSVDLGRHGAQQPDDEGEDEDKPQYPKAYHLQPWVYLTRSMRTSCQSSAETRT